MIPGVTLRAATPADAEALATVHVQAWHETYGGLIPQAVLDRLDPAERAAMWRKALSGGATVLLAELGGAIVGFGHWREQPEASLTQSAEIGALYILACAQRRGIGRALMSGMARELIAHGHASVSLWVLEGNTQARQFYEALGGRVLLRQDQERGGFQSVGVAYGWDDLTGLA